MSRRWATILWVLVSVQMVGLGYAVIKIGNFASEGQKARDVQCRLAPVSERLYTRAHFEGWIRDQDYRVYVKYRARC